MQKKKKKRVKEEQNARRAGIQRHVLIMNFLVKAVFSHANLSRIIESGTNLILLAIDFTGRGGSVCLKMIM